MSGRRERLLSRASARDIALHIRRMARLVRGAVLAPPSRVRPQQMAELGLGPEGAEEIREQPGREEAGAGPGWWVLAQGGVLNEQDFAAREAEREALLAAVRRAGILVGENVWVWDESGRAQLVLSTLPTLERARRVAQRLRGKGLMIVVRREMA